MILKVKDISTGYLHSRKIGQLAEELPSLDLEADADFYVECYAVDRTQRKKLIPADLMARILRVLWAEYGMPTSYEVSQYFGKTSQRTTASRKVHTTQEKSFGRLVYYSPKTLQKAIDLVNAVKHLTSDAVYVGSNNIVKFFVAEDCFVQNLMKSDLPSEWERLNAHKFSLTVKRRKLKEVEEKLDRK